VGGTVRLEGSFALLVGIACLGARPAAGADEAPGVSSSVLGRAVYARAYSEDSEGLGGNSVSANTPRRWPGTAPAKPEVVVLVEPTTRCEVEGRVGMRVVVLNATKERVAFSAQDAMLDLVQEAREPGTGEWRPIEYMPRSWCGNSYHQVFLGPGECWEVAAPRYTGELRAQLRFKLTISRGEKGPVEVFSAPFEGSVNPGQFLNKQGHRPTNVMDPYDE
jgi:hypothetical protein